ncbi:ribosyldihydronicotinamide dehydrogenase [quinone] isoform X2 [Sciurus carolinensis]|uniref:ribosyldihydronicotinamide dehydrogenase [quinone] isoform X2 n=1 Tax=Sciurus carolinensis TaxID=30640 RepID=UPI001FB30B62|nr:ribosyldihydronicotinamide dehydrogenase [quinone] isoform X2 [Sciurus carolinensis]
MAGKRVLIVYAHQEPKSFNGSLKQVAVDELSKQGCTVTVSDLYAMNFEPRATRKDITGALSNPEVFSYGVEAYEAYKKGCLTSDITDEQKKVQEADLVIFQFPLYWFTVPAILKGWMDRVLCQGFAFDIPGFYDSGFLKEAQPRCTRKQESAETFGTFFGHSSMALCTSVDLKSLPLRSILLLSCHQKKKEKQ